MTAGGGRNSYVLTSLSLHPPFRRTPYPMTTTRSNPYLAPGKRMEVVGQAAAAKKQLAGTFVVNVLRLIHAYTSLYLFLSLTLSHTHTHHAKPTEALGLLKPRAPSAPQDNDAPATADNKTDLLKSLINNTPAMEEERKVVAAVELDAEGAQLPMLLELAKGQRILARALVALPPQQVSGGKGTGGAGHVSVCM